MIHHAINLNLRFEVIDQRILTPPSVRFVTTLPSRSDSAISTMGPAPLNVPASPSPNKTQKASGSGGVNGATKPPPAVKNTIAPSDISSPHELTAFVCLRSLSKYHFSSWLRTRLIENLGWLICAGSCLFVANFLRWDRSRRCSNNSKPNSTMYLLKSSNEVRNPSPSPFQN